mmetsp:Transcript_70051/g.177818  ORF Transcript_70051/g.177818 Transcript_70051/m.177818 type:complete len:299 (+) Transcript_70051:121-1017(+)
MYLSLPEANSLTNLAFEVPDSASFLLQPPPEPWPVASSKTRLSGEDFFGLTRYSAARSSGPQPTPLNSKSSSTVIHLVSRAHLKNSPFAEPASALSAVLNSTVAMRVPSGSASKSKIPCESSSAAKFTMTGMGNFSRSSLRSLRTTSSQKSRKNLPLLLVSLVPSPTGRLSGWIRSYGLSMPYRPEKTRTLEFAHLSSSSSQFMPSNALKRLLSYKPQQGTGVMPSKFPKCCAYSLAKASLTCNCFLMSLGSSFFNSCASALALEFMRGVVLVMHSPNGLAWNRSDADTRKSIARLAR